MNTEECCALGAMKAIHLIQEQKLVVNSVRDSFMDKEFVVYGYGEIDNSHPSEDSIVFDTHLQLPDDPSLDHDCMHLSCGLIFRGNCTSKLERHI